LIPHVIENINKQHRGIQFIQDMLSLRTVLLESILQIYFLCISINCMLDFISYICNRWIYSYWYKEL